MYSTNILLWGYRENLEMCLKCKFYELEKALILHPKVVFIRHSRNNNNNNKIGIVVEQQCNAFCRRKDFITKKEKFYRFVMLYSIASMKRLYGIPSLTLYFLASLAAGSQQWNPQGSTSPSK